MDSTASAAGALFGLVAAAGFVALILWPYYRILNKSGYSGWYCLLGLIPLVNLVALYTFAFSEWPLEQRQRLLGTRECPYCKSSIAAAATVCRYCQRESAPVKVPIEQAPTVEACPARRDGLPHEFVKKPFGVEECWYCYSKKSRPLAIDEQACPRRPGGGAHEWKKFLAGQYCAFCEKPRDASVANQSTVSGA